MDIVVSLNKPEGITSHDAVERVKKTLRAKKAGHAGTLDPMATGLLLICTNRATRLAGYFSVLDKEYRAVMKLGETTDTQDAAGTVLNRTAVIDLKPEKIVHVLSTFTGEVLQQPPMYSALKHRGKPLYKLARKGIAVERAPRKVTIRRMEVLDITLPYVSFRIICSKGTYIRTLCHDVGSMLGVGAHLNELERTAIGPFTVKGSITLEELGHMEKCTPGNKGIYSMDASLSWMPAVSVPEDCVKGVTHGTPVPVTRIAGLPEGLCTNDTVRVTSPAGKLLALGSLTQDGKVIRMTVVLASSGSLQRLPGSLR